MNEQREFNRYITLGHIIVWVALGLIAGPIPLIGPFLLGVVMMNVRTSKVADRPLFLRMVFAIVGQSASCYLMTERWWIVLAQNLIFLSVCAGMWCYQYLSLIHI